MKKEITIKFPTVIIFIFLIVSGVCQDSKEDELR